VLGEEDGRPSSLCHGELLLRVPIARAHEQTMIGHRSGFGGEIARLATRLFCGVGVL